MNILSGCFACLMAFEGNYLWVIIWVVIGAVFDFFDGFSARLLKAYSPMGKELDSLADMVTFGLAPAIALFRLLSNIVDYNTESVLYPLLKIIPYISFMLVIFSGLRLAKFNIDERQTSSFIGLPTPANALFWISYCFSIYQQNTSQSSILFVSAILIIIFSLLMTAEIPMFSLKINNLKFKGNELRYLLIVIMIAGITTIGIGGISIGIVSYIIMSIFSKKTANSQKK